MNPISAPRISTITMLINSFMNIHRIIMIYLYPDYNRFVFHSQWLCQLFYILSVRRGTRNDTPPPPLLGYWGNRGLMRRPPVMKIMWGAWLYLKRNIWRKIYLEIKNVAIPKPAVKRHKHLYALSHYRMRIDELTAGVNVSDWYD